MAPGVSLFMEMNLLAGIIICTDLYKDEFNEELVFDTYNDIT